MKSLNLQEDGAIDHNSDAGVANDNEAGNCCIAQPCHHNNEGSNKTGLHKRIPCPIFSKRKCCNVLIVCLMCCIAFPTYFLLELPAGMEKTIIEVMQLTTTQYNVLYSLFYLPTVLLAPVGGLIIDKFRTERALPLFLLSCTLGQILLSIGIFSGQYWLMIIGRVFTGAGGMMFVCLSSYIASYFISNVNLINGILLGTARLGATASVNLNSLFYTSLIPHVTDHHARLGIVLILSVVLIVLALLCSLLLWYAHCCDAKTTATNRKHFKCYRCSRPSLYYILLVLVAGVFYAAVLTPASVGELYYMQKYGISLAISNLVNSFTHILPIFLCPLFGLIINHVGYNPVWILVSVLIGSFSHLLLAYSSGDKLYSYIGSFTGGLSYSLFTTSLWPMVSLIVKPEFIGVGYGMQQAVISCFQVLVASTVGSIADNNGYFMVQLYYVGLSLTALSLVLVLNMIDCISRNGRVNISGKQRVKLQMKT